MSHTLRCGTLNKGRGLRPGDTVQSRRLRVATYVARSLNKGRGLRPGDTTLVARPVVGLTVAQQRPGPSPRRHTAVDEALWAPGSAQQRPGPSPRRHLGVTLGIIASRAASAQQRPGPSPRRHDLDAAGIIYLSTPTPLNKGRGLRPGDTSPTTFLTITVEAPALNKGRGLRPGDTP